MDTAMNYVQLLIKNFNGDIQQPILYEGISLNMKRSGSPEKLTFKVQKGGGLFFNEGSEVSLTVDGTKVFVGYVFTKSRDKDGCISVTAYSQIRYLKNKYATQYENKTATEVIQKLCDSFGVNYKDKDGKSAICDTQFKIAQRLEDNVTLLDMIQNALNPTLNATGKLYVLYDDCGVLTLKDIKDESMLLDFGIDSETAQNFDYETSIDKESYNSITIVRDAQEGQHGAEKVHVEDGSHIKKWGHLQYFEKAQEGDSNLMEKAKTLLELYNRETRTLRIKEAFGDLRVRAGCSIYVNLNLGDMVLTSRMVVEEVTHKFNKDIHTMDLAVIGHGFTK